MSVLVTTLRAVLEAADRTFDDGRVSAARAGYVDLLSRAQDRSDPSMETLARAMLAICALRLRDRASAEEQLDASQWRLDSASVEAQARHRRAAARLSMERDPREQVLSGLHSYLAWAEDHRIASGVLDACLLLADLHGPADRVLWLEHGLDYARAHDLEQGLGRAYGLLGSTLDQLEQPEQALVAWQQALACHERQAQVRGRVGAGWAAGELACRLEDWPLARQHLEAALALAEGAQDCSDLEPLILGDLAVVYEAAGDVIEARRLILRALARAREQELHVFAASRHQRLRAVAKRLDLDA